MTSSTAPTPGSGFYYPLTPSRVLDTRFGSGQQNAGQTVGPASTINFYPGTVTFEPGGQKVPSDATAVVLNVTATNPTASSYLTVWGTGGSQPLASNLNFPAGTTIPNRVIVPINPTTKQASVYNNLGSTDVVADVVGYFSPSAIDGVTTPTSGSAYYPLVTPTRIADTRAGSGQPYAGQTLGQAAIRTINVPADTPAPTGFAAPPAFNAVNANVTVADGTASSFLTVYPANAGGLNPLASNLNWTPGEFISNADYAATTVSTPATALDVYNNAGSTDVVIDVSGYFALPTSPVGRLPA
jgi:hypothetical protein